MKRILLLTIFSGVMFLSLIAQDDLYFTPSKVKKDKTAVSPKKSLSSVSHIGSNRDVDEYNRRKPLKSTYQNMDNDTLSGDIIDFQVGDGVYGTSVENDTVDSQEFSALRQYDNDFDYDYAYSRNLGRFYEFYGWYDPFFYRYWYGPYRFSYGWYDPWIYSWYDPWYYGWYNHWYYHGWYGWGYPHYHGWGGWYPSYYYSYSRPTGTTNHSRGTYLTGSRTTGFSGYRGSSDKSYGSFGNRNNSSYNNNNYSQQNNNTTRKYNFGGQRQNNNNSVSRPATRPAQPSIGTGSFGGGRSGGGSFGGRR